MRYVPALNQTLREILCLRKGEPLLFAASDVISKCLKDLPLNKAL